MVCIAESEDMFLRGSGSRWGLSRTSRKTVSPVFDVLWNWNNKIRGVCAGHSLPPAWSAWSRARASWSSPCSPPSPSRSPRTRPSSRPPPAGSSSSSRPSAWKSLLEPHPCPPLLRRPPSSDFWKVSLSQSDKKTLVFPVREQLMPWPIIPTVHLSCPSLDLNWWESPTNRMPPPP